MRTDDEITKLHLCASRTQWRHASSKSIPDKLTLTHHIYSSHAYHLQTSLHSLIPLSNLEGKFSHYTVALNEYLTLYEVVNLFKWLIFLHRSVCNSQLCLACRLQTSSSMFT